MSNRHRRVFGSFAVLVGTVLALGACSSNRVLVKVPPQRDLSQFGRIGIIEFAGNDQSLTPMATRQFQQEAQTAQPGLAVVELGNESWLLGSIGMRNLDGAALKAIAEKHDVDAVFMGDVNVSQATPSFDFSNMDIFQMRGSVDLNADMQVRLVETRGGATVWSRTAVDSIEIARADIFSSGSRNVSVRDPEGVYLPLVAGLARCVTDEFRPRFVRQKIEHVPPHYVIEYDSGNPVYAPPTTPRENRATVVVTEQ